MYFNSKHVQIICIVNSLIKVIRAYVIAIVTLKAF